MTFPWLFHGQRMRQKTRPSVLLENNQRKYYIKNKQRIKFVFPPPQNMNWNRIAILHEYFVCNLQSVWLSEWTCICEDTFLKVFLNKTDKSEKGVKNDAQFSPQNIFTLLSGGCLVILIYWLCLSYRDTQRTQNLINITCEHNSPIKCWTPICLRKQSF